MLFLTSGNTVSASHVWSPPYLQCSNVQQAGSSSQALSLVVCCVRRVWERSQCKVSFKQVLTCLLAPCQLLSCCQCCGKAPKYGDATNRRQPPTCRP